MIWRLAHRADPACRALADQHYSRQSIGSACFMPPGRDCVLRADHDQAAVALWGVSWQDPAFVDHAWPGAWVCTIFRRAQSAPWFASEMIRDAIAATRWKLGAPPEQGLITFVDAAKVERKRQPGRCFRLAGFRKVGVTKQNGLVVLQILPDQMPTSEAPLYASLDLFGGSK